MEGMAEPMALKPHPFQCKYVSERGGIQCQLSRHHVDSMNPENRDHRAWNDEGIPTLKMPSTPSDLSVVFLAPLPLISRLRDVDSEEKGQIDGERKDHD
jgi:hypothetical protein